MLREAEVGLCERQSIAAVAKKLGITEGPG